MPPIVKGGEPPAKERRSPSTLLLLATFASCICGALVVWVLAREQRLVTPAVGAVDEFALHSEPSPVAGPPLTFHGQTARRWEDPEGGASIIEPRAEFAAEGPAVPPPVLKPIATAALIVQMRSTNDRWLKTDLVEELASRRAVEGSDAISVLLADEDRDVRRTAADALAELGDRATLPALNRALSREQDGRVRAAFVEAIDELRER